jgi:hypothetical protein
MYSATLHCGYVVDVPCGLMTGRSIPSASTTTRVASRSRFAVADDVGAGMLPIGGRLGTAGLSPGSNVTIVGSAETGGFASAG